MTFASCKDLPEFKIRKGIQKVIAFSGGASSVPPEFDKELGDAISKASSQLEESVISEALRLLLPYSGRVAILTGGTEWGIPSLASRVG